MSVYQHALNGTVPPVWRETPPGQATVPELVLEGMTIRTSYGTGGIVVGVRGPFTRFWELKHPPSWTILYVVPADFGTHGGVPARWFDNPRICAINDVGAVDGRLLNLCSDVETFITSTARIAPVDRRGQIGLIL